jgi:hypothetical protein
MEKSGEFSEIIKGSGLTFRLKILEIDLKPYGNPVKGREAQQIDALQHFKVKPFGQVTRRAIFLPDSAVF